MPLYMTQVGYTPEAWAALTQNPEDRSEAFGRLAETPGGQLVSFYNSLGEYDPVVIYEVPDESTAAAIVLAAVSPGHLSSVKTTVLLTAEEGLEAMRKAGEATYRAPPQLLLRIEFCVNTVRAWFEPPTAFAFEALQVARGPFQPKFVVIHVVESPLVSLGP